MRSGLLVWTLAGLVGGIWLPWSHSRVAPVKAAESANVKAPELIQPAPAKQAVRFESHIQPILSTRCQPCHFPGGIMYERLPFDRAETVHKLGTRLFGRIKDEEEQALIRSFLAQKH